MNHYVLNPTSGKTTPALNASDEIRGLVAAMPIVTFVQALSYAFRRPAGVRIKLRTSEPN